VSRARCPGPARAVAGWFLAAAALPVSAKGGGDEESAAGVVAAATVPAAALAEPTESGPLRVSGDFRLRGESSFERDDQPNRTRARIRARLGATYDVNEELRVGARLVTGDPKDPNSPHVTLGDGLTSDDVSLDRYFVEYRPGGSERTRLTAGKFAHPFAANPVYGELVWDADVQPEGFVVEGRWDEVGPFDTLGATAGAYVLAEQDLAGDAELVALQVRARRRFGAASEGGLAVGYYCYGDTQPDGTTVLVGQNAGNAVVDLDMNGTPDAFVSEFSILHSIVDVRCSGWGEPLTFGAEAMKNLDAVGPRDSGWALGVSLGESRRKGDWSYYYQYQSIEQDAVFSAFAGDDLLLTTNHDSHVAGVKHRLADAVELHLWALVSSRREPGPGPTMDSDDAQWRVRLDLNISL